MSAADLDLDREALVSIVAEVLLINGPSFAEEGGLFE